MFQPDLFNLTAHLPTPLLVIDTAEVCANIERIRRALPSVEVFYAVKCNADPRLLAAVEQARAGFEIASLSEAETILQMGVPTERIICLHPIKSPEFLRYLHRHGIDILAADDAHELDKITAHAPGSRIVLRVAVSNEGSVVPLNRKFGAAPSEIVRLLRHARARGLQPHGLTIHVGSQCERLETWRAALEICRQVCAEARQHDFEFSMLSLGGGLPAPYTDDALTLAAIGAEVQAALPRIALPPASVLSVEPGRAVAASAAVLLATVTGLAERDDGRWAYLDAGTYHGLFEASRIGGGQIPFSVITQNGERQRRVYRLAGPTCDSFDLPFEEIALPELRLGDRVAVLCAGAYSTALSSTFNGFPAPRVYGLEELRR